MVSIPHGGLRTNDNKYLVHYNSDVVVSIPHGGLRTGLFQGLV